MSQWSLTFEVRKSGIDGRREPVTEPVSQWSLTFEVRKSASTRIYGAALILSQWSLTFEVRKRSR